jgi:hypothetical protein
MKSNVDLVNVNTSECPGYKLLQNRATFHQRKFSHEIRYKTIIGNTEQHYLAPLLLTLFLTQE